MTNPVAMIADLEKRFTDVVAVELDKVSGRLGGGDHWWSTQYAVKFVEPLSGTDLMFHIEVEIVGQVFIDEMVLIAKALDTFCADESDPVMLHGLAFRLGDGDDASAVFFEEGKFKIWLRGFNEPAFS